MTTNTLPLRGSMVALVTPMHNDGTLDWESLGQLVERHIEQGTDALVAMGTTGESATLNVGEHVKVIEYVVDKTHGRIPVVAGTGANSTSEAIELTREAHKLGASACLLVVPYYNKPTQEGLYRHFMAIADAVEIPQILYNVPGRTITDMENDTALRLATHSNIVGIKDATGDIERGQRLINQVPDNFVVYSGDDLTAYELMLRGAKGNISVTANVAPALMAELCRVSMAGEREAACQLQHKLLSLHQALFVESNPIPVKWAVAEQGLMQQGIRLPLTPLSESYQQPLRQAMIDLSLLSVSS